MYKYHECDFLPITGVSIIYAESLLCGEHDAWNLVIEREATEEDLEENHYLENVGDTIWQTVMEIHCCPFCGSVLSQSREKGKVGTFIRYDMSRWNGGTC